MRGRPAQSLQLVMRNTMRPRDKYPAAQRALLSITVAHRCRPGGDTTRKTVSASTVSAAQQQPLKRTGAAGEEAESGNPELPKFSLDGLGIGRNMKVFLIVVLSIFGTMETWFYCKAIWRWWYGAQGPAVAADDDQ